MLNHFIVTDNLCIWYVLLWNDSYTCFICYRVDHIHIDVNIHMCWVCNKWKGPKPGVWCNFDHYTYTQSLFHWRPRWDWMSSRWCVPGQSTIKKTVLPCEWLCVQWNFSLWSWRKRKDALNFTSEYSSHVTRWADQDWWVTLHLYSVHVHMNSVR